MPRLEPFHLLGEPERSLQLRGFARLADAAGRRKNHGQYEAPILNLRLHRAAAIDIMGAGKLRKVVVANASLLPLQLVDADEDARRFDAMVETMAGVPTLVSAPLPVFAVVAEIARLAGLLERLGEPDGSP